MKTIKKTALALSVIFVLIQFYRPKKNTALGNHTAIFIVETNPPQNVKVILEQGCYDCHSNNTKYPWYNDIAPVSYWLSNHVKNGKRHLNFSEWEGYTVKKKDHKLEEVIEMMNEGEMPLKEYTWTHEEARLTQEERDAVIEWAKRIRVLYQLNLQPE